VKCFPDVSHGWTTRGDVADATVARDAALAIDLVLDFTKAHASA